MRLLKLLLPHLSPNESQTLTTYKFQGTQDDGGNAQDIHLRRKKTALVSSFSPSLSTLLAYIYLRGKRSEKRWN